MPSRTCAFWHGNAHGYKRTYLWTLLPRLSDQKALLTPNHSTSCTLAATALQAESNQRPSSASASAPH